MPYSEPPSGSSFHQHPSWFDGGPRRLRGLLLIAGTLIAGMFLGRFLTQSEMQRTVTELKAELASRDAEIGLLHHEAKQPLPQERELERLNEQHQQLLARFDALEKNFAQQKELIQREMESAVADRQACLSELREFQQRQRSLPADNVLEFAERMFEVRQEILKSLTDGRVRAAESEKRVPFPVIHDPDVSDEKVVGLVQSEKIHPAETSVAGNIRSEKTTGVFFEPPRRPTGYTFLTPRRSSRVAVKQHGLSFSDGSDHQEGPILR